MATDKTRTVSGRVPVAVAEALDRDAADLGMKPGSLLRQILEGRYRVPRSGGKTVTVAESRTAELVHFTDVKE